MQANAISFKHRLCFDQLDSPRIGAGQEIFQEKRGVSFSAFARHERFLRETSRPDVSMFEKEPWRELTKLNNSQPALLTETERTLGMLIKTRLPAC